MGFEVCVRNRKLEDGIRFALVIRMLRVNHSDPQKARVALCCASVVVEYSL